MQVRLDSVSSKLCLNFMYFLLSFVLIFHSVVLKFVLLPCFDKNSFGRVTKMSVCVCVFFFWGGDLIDSSYILMVMLFLTWWNGSQVTKVARMLAAKPAASEHGLNSYVVMALLDGGLLRRHKTWLKVLHLSLFLSRLNGFYVKLSTNWRRVLG